MPTTTLAAIRALPDCGVDLDQIPDNVPHGGYASIFFGRLRATGERVAVKVRERLAAQASGRFADSLARPAPSGAAE